MTIKELNIELGNMDIYLMDQVLKGSFLPGMRILDAGCGEGRNLIFFLNNNFEVHGLDSSPDAIRMLQFIARSKQRDSELFQVGSINSLPYESTYFDAVISSAVLHFCNGVTEFLDSVDEAVRVLRPDGLFFVRMTSDLGIKEELQPLEDGKFQNPDGSVRFLLTRSLLDQVLERHPLRLAEPFKSVVVDHQRSMASLVFRKTPVS